MGSKIYLWKKNLRWKTLFEHLHIILKDGYDLLESKRRRKKKI